MENVSGRCRILLVDDADAVRESLRYLLEHEPDLSVVGEARDGSEAITQAAALMPDLVILDIRLPNLDGYVTARALKLLAHPPIIIFLTAHGSPAIQQQALASGGDGYVEKSQGWGALLAEVRRAISSFKS